MGHLRFRCRGRGRATVRLRPASRRRRRISGSRRLHRGSLTFRDLFCLSSSLDPAAEPGDDLLSRQPRQITEPQEELLVRRNATRREELLKMAGGLLRQPALR
eukprot:5594785-Prymnesium_polylepis.1